MSRKRISIPDEDELPEGPHRHLLAEVHRLYDLAGCPSTRVISNGVRNSSRARDVLSHQTVANILRGRSFPSWLKVEALVDVLATYAQTNATAEELERFRLLWLTAHHDENRTPSSNQIKSSGTGPPDSQAPHDDSRDSRAEDDVPTDDDGDYEEGNGQDSFEDQNVRFVARRWDGPEMFKVDLLPGIIEVSVNITHPVGKSIVATWENDNDSDVRRILHLLLVAWARMEDETPHGRRLDFLRMTRSDWSRYARLFSTEDT